MLLGFPIGGWLAHLVIGPVDAPGTALAGGLVCGTVIGAAQWCGLRRFLPRLWIAATGLGMAIGLAVGAQLVDYGTSRRDLLAMGAVTGLGVGGLQAAVLARRRVPGATLWAIANPLAWALGWLITSYVITSNVDEQFATFGAGGALVFGIITGLLIDLPHRRAP